MVFPPLVAAWQDQLAIVVSIATSGVSLHRGCIRITPARKIDITYTIWCNKRIMATISIPRLKLLVHTQSTVKIYKIVVFFLIPELKGSVHHVKKNAIFFLVRLIMGSGAH